MKENEEQIKAWKEQIQTWFNRAGMAYQMGNRQLAQEALNHRWSYQKQLADLEGTPPPDPPANPEDYFKYIDSGWGRGFDPGDPHQPAGVPRRPHPNTGAGEIALPTPQKSDDDELK